MGGRGKRRTEEEIKPSGLQKNFPLVAGEGFANKQNYGKLFFS